LGRNIQSWDNRQLNIRASIKDGASTIIRGDGAGRGKYGPPYLISIERMADMIRSLLINRLGLFIIIEIYYGSFRILSIKKKIFDLMIYLLKK